MFEIELPQLLSFLIGTILPLLTGLVTRWNASPGVRAVVLLALSAVTSLLTEYLAALNSGTLFDVGAALLGVLATFLVGVGSHFGFWRPTGAAQALQATGGFIGGSRGSTRGSGGTVAP
ncbi:MAG: hypothetical protein HOY78_02335 [Saccharothrix sp.]|nr:hypothetical protein [Saccharothrix sp.]